RDDRQWRPGSGRGGHGRQRRSADGAHTGGEFQHFQFAPGVSEPLMIEITPHSRVLAAIDPVDGRKGIDGLAQVCRSVLKSNPMSGTIFAFRNRNARTLRLLMYDGQGFWLAMKRLSRGRFVHWPRSATDAAGATLLAHQFR